MIVAAFGAPTVFTSFGFKLVRAAINTIEPGAIHVEAHSVEQLCGALAGRECRLIGVTSHLPDQGLIDLLVDQNCPILLFWSDGVEILADHVRFGASFLTSARLASKYLSTMDGIRAARIAEVFEWPLSGKCLTDLVAEIASSARLKINGDHCRHIVRTLAPGIEDVQSLAADSVIDRRTTEFDVADKIPKHAPPLYELGRMFGVSSAGDLPWSGVSSWPPILFSRPQLNDQSTDPIVNLTGPARAFINGPYFHLPQGSWQAAINFRVWENETNNAFCFEIRSGDHLSSGDFKSPPTGEFTCELDFTTPGAEFVVEIRLILAEGAIGGIFELLNVSIKPDLVSQSYRANHDREPCRDNGDRSYPQTLSKNSQNLTS